MILKGKVHKFGDDVNTDEIIPARYLSTSDPAELARHCMEDANPRFPAFVKPGDLIMAGRNFGCGSSREHAPIAIKAAGIQCVVAQSFARIFYRNAINIGLPIIESPEACAAVKDGDSISIDTQKGTIKALKSGAVFTSEKFSPFIQKIIDAGGLMESLGRKK